jgi:site-specific recombinase XerD
MFMLMLRTTSRRSRQLTLATLDLRRIPLIVYEGKGLKDRIVYLSRDALTIVVYSPLHWFTKFFL